MKLPFNQAILLAPLVLAMALPASAQELQYGVKFGGGAVVGAIGPQASRATMNAAFMVERPIGKTSEVFAEFNYRVYRSVDHEATQFGTGFTPSGTTGAIIPQTSVDIRKDNLEGYALNLGYRRQFLDTLFWWQGGISLNNLSSQQEVTGQLAPGVATAAAVNNTNREGLNFTPGKSSLRPGLFLGAQAKITPNFFVEANVSGVGYQWVNYVPYSYTGQPAHVETTNKFKVSIDLNLGFRF